jgi:hypothetical protein
VNGSDIIRAKFAVHTDHPRLPLLHLTAHGELRDRLSRAPRDVRFGFVGRKVLDAGDPDAAELWRDISVVYLGEAPLEITSVLAQPDFLRVEPLEKADGPDRVLRVRISPGAPSGPLNGWVKAETNFGTLYWPVTGTIK